MKKLILFSFLALSFTLQSQVNLPATVRVHMPSYIEHPTEMNNMEWMLNIKRGRYGSNTGSYWIVYSDKSDNVTYSAPMVGTPYKKLYFGQKLIIADIQNSFALVYEPSEYIDGSIVKGESQGWINLEDLLLWDISPMDKNKVFRKAVALINLDAKTQGDISPDFFSNPFNGKKNGKSANKLEFYFIMKTANINGKVFYLLSKEWTIGQSIGTVNNLYGWLSEGNISQWDNRLCFEPNWDSEAVNEFNTAGIKPMVLKSIEYAQNYKNSGITNIDNAYWVDENFEASRNDPQLIRLPLISDEKDLPRGIYKVASIGRVSGEVDQGSNGYATTISEDGKARMEAKVQELITKINNVNIIFVVDGTISMGKYFKPISKAIDRTMREGLKSSYKIGAVVYRDYPDNEKVIEKINLTDNFEKVSNFLNNCEAKQPNGADRNLEEAMFLGLETAASLFNSSQIEKKDKQSNFIFLIGDCGNHNPDPQGKNINNVIDDLVNARVNVLAFQAHNANDRAYNSFNLQVGQIISKTIEGITTQAGSKGSVGMKLFDKGLYKTYRIGSNQNEITPVIGGYTFCNPYENKDPNYLEKLIEEMINDYDEYVDKKIKEIQNFLAGATVDSDTPLNAIGKIPTAVREEFKIRWGWSDSQINMLRGDVQLKVAGYTSENPGNKKNDIFVPVLFISHEEYTRLLNNLRKLKSNEFVNSRTAYYEALRSLALSFFGNIDVEQLEIETLMTQMYGIPSKFKPGTLNDVKIIDILEPKRVSQQKLEEYIENFNNRMPKFEKIQHDGSYIFRSNGLKYYWIPVSELP